MNGQGTPVSQRQVAVDGDRIIVDFFAAFDNFFMMRILAKLYENAYGKEGLEKLYDEIFNKLWPSFEAQLNRMLASDVKGLATIKGVIKEAFEKRKKEALDGLEVL